MNFLLQNATCYIDGVLHKGNVSVCGGRVFFNEPVSSIDRVIDCSNYTILPGFTDVHVHLREPGFSYKETIAGGTLAAAHGGYTRICAMPNLNPAPDSMAALQVELDIIAKDACIPVIPYGTITKGEKGETLADLSEMAPYVAGFSDDGKGVQNEQMMRSAMKEAGKLGKLIVAHCEDNSLLRGGYIHDGAYAKAHGHRGICSESEWGPIARDVAIAAETGCGYHVCHVSAKESVDVIRRAKAAGVDVTCETGPHYLLMDESMLQEDGRFKMNPPIRGIEDRDALREGILDGTIDMIITDHAPHSAEEKSRGLEKSLMGVVGLETCFPLLYTYLVKPGIISLRKLMELMHDNPCRRFRLDNPFEEGKPANFTVYDLNASYSIDPETFLGHGRSTPFAGWKVNGKCMLTAADGKIAYIDDALKGVQE